MTSLRDIEAASLRAWPALEEAEVDGWVLRFADGFSKRANSVQPFAGPRAFLAERVRRCEMWYAERGRPCIFRLTQFSEEGLDSYLAARGYGLVEPTDVLVGSALHLLGGHPDAELSAVSLTEWLDCFGRASGDAVLPPALGRIIAKIQAPTLLGVLQPGALAGVVGCGLAVRDGPLVGLFDLAVAPEFRGRGYGTELIRRLVAWGFEQGATAAYLQVTRENARAASLYGRIGFRSAYAYHYRVQEG